MGWLEKQREEADKEAITHYAGEDGIPGIRLRDRKCTDPFMCCLFLLWIVIMVAISGYSFANGDMNRIAWKFDMDLVNCTKEHPKKLFTRIIPDFSVAQMASFDPATGPGLAVDSHWSVCAKKCPKKGDKVDYLQNSQYNTSMKGLSATDQVKRKAIISEMDKWE
jgi:hypothetical protein